MVDDMDSSEEEAFFSGKPTAADETEWFIRDMEVGACVVCRDVLTCLRRPWMVGRRI
jgi:hypothetical protein